MRMLSSTLRRNIAAASLQNLQKRLLDTFAGDIAGNTDVIGFATDLVYFIDINNSNLGPLNVVICILQQAQDDVLDVFADITGFGQSRGISDAKWHIENLGKRPGEKSLPTPGGADHQDIALFNLDVGVRIEGQILCWVGVEDALVMVVHCDRKDLFSRVLTDHMLIELPPDLGRFRYTQRRGLPAGILV